MSTAALVMQPSLPPMVRRVRAYFAPVNRTSGTPEGFDASTAAVFDVDAAPAPWVDLGWVSTFTRTSETKLQLIESGAPAAISMQGRSSIGATLAMHFERWSKLTMALSCGAMQTNVLQAGSAPVAINATASTSTFLATPNGAGAIVAGDIVAVDQDCTTQTGFVGAGASAAYLNNAVTSDVNWIRRVTLNVGRVTAVLSTGLQLAEPLLAGAPTAGMQVQPVTAFQDREGGTFFHEWSGLFVMPGDQGDTLFFYYPRLQTAAGTSESAAIIGSSLSQLMLSGKFVALPVVDSLDGAQVCCYRTYLPCATAQV